MCLLGIRAICCALLGGRRAGKVKHLERCCSRVFLTSGRVLEPSIEVVPRLEFKKFVFEQSTVHLKAHISVTFCGNFLAKCMQCFDYYLKSNVQRLQRCFR